MLWGKLPNFTAHVGLLSCTYVRHGSSPEIASIQFQILSISSTNFLIMSDGDKGTETANSAKKRLDQVKDHVAPRGRRREKSVDDQLPADYSDILGQLKTLKKIAATPDTTARGYVRQKQAGKLWVRERVDQLLDPGSFKEVGSVSGTVKWKKVGEAREEPVECEFESWLDTASTQFADTALQTFHQIMFKASARFVVEPLCSPPTTSLCVLDMPMVRSWQRRYVCSSPINIPLTASSVIHRGTQRCSQNANRQACRWLIGWWIRHHHQDDRLFVSPSYQELQHRHQTIEWRHPELRSCPRTCHRSGSCKSGRLSFHRHGCRHR